MSSRVVNEKLHGKTTKRALYDIRQRVADGYQSIYKARGWSAAMQSMLTDIHYLLTFFRSDDEPK